MWPRADDAVWEQRWHALGERLKEELYQQLERRLLELHALPEARLAGLAADCRAETKLAMERLRQELLEAAPPRRAVEAQPAPGEGPRLPAEVLAKCQQLEAAARADRATAAQAVNEVKSDFELKFQEVSGWIHQLELRLLDSCAAQALEVKSYTDALVRSIEDNHFSAQQVLRDERAATEKCFVKTVEQEQREMGPFHVDGTRNVARSTVAGDMSSGRVRIALPCDTLGALQRNVQHMEPQLQSLQLHLQQCAPALVATAGCQAAAEAAAEEPRACLGMRARQGVSWVATARGDLGDKRPRVGLARAITVVAPAGGEMPDWSIVPPCQVVRSRSAEPARAWPAILGAGKPHAPPPLGFVTPWLSPLAPPPPRACETSPLGAAVAWTSQRVQRSASPEAAGGQQEPAMGQAVPAGVASPVRGRCGPRALQRSLPRSGQASLRP